MNDKKWMTIKAVVEGTVNTKNELSKNIFLKRMHEQKAAVA